MKIKELIAAYMRDKLSGDNLTPTQRNYRSKTRAVLKYLPNNIDTSVFDSLHNDGLSLKKGAVKYRSFLIHFIENMEDAKVSLDYQNGLFQHLTHVLMLIQDNGFSINWIITAQLKK